MLVSLGVVTYGGIEALRRFLPVSTLFLVVPGHFSMFLLFQAITRPSPSAHRSVP